METRVLQGLGQVASFYHGPMVFATKLRVHYLATHLNHLNSIGSPHRIFRGARSVIWRFTVMMCGALGLYGATCRSI